jgi:hypothetical protein
LEGADDVLDALAGRGARVQPLAEPELGPAEQRHQHDRADRQSHGEDGDVGVAAVDQLPDRFDDEGRREQEEAGSVSGGAPVLEAS